MKQVVARPVRRALRRMGYDVVRVPGDVAPDPLPPDCDDFTASVIERIGPYTLTSHERVMALVDAVRYVVRAEVPGAFVECGVWRGGSSMAMAMTLLELGVRDRDLVLYDTFTHMPFPGDEDVDLYGIPAAEIYDEASAAEAFRYLPFEDVRGALTSTGYDESKLHFVQGMVEDTLPSRAPEAIALCRLDTDWYSSTAHEMEHLWPRISPGGVLLIDDYGHFMGAKKAVDEYVDAHDLPVLLNRIDFTGRLIVKPR